MSAFPGRERTSYKLLHWGREYVNYSDHIKNGRNTATRKGRFTYKLENHINGTNNWENIGIRHRAQLWAAKRTTLNRKRAGGNERYGGVAVGVNYLWCSAQKKLPAVGGRSKFGRPSHLPQGRKQTQTKNSRGAAGGCVLTFPQASTCW